MVGGGDYERVGLIERAMLDAHAPVPPGGLLVDVGCGPGRLSRYLTGRKDLRYLGTDVVPELLVVARDECQRPDWSFVEVEGCAIPAADGVADVVVIFSVFTNIYPEQAYLITSAAFRVLKPGGRLLATYFDITTPYHQQMFKILTENEGRRHDPLVFLDENFLRFFAASIGFGEPTFTSAEDAAVRLPAGSCLNDGREIEGSHSLAQCVCVLRKPVPSENGNRP